MCMHFDPNTSGINTLPFHVMLECSMERFIFQLLERSQDRGYTPAVFRPTFQYLLNHLEHLVSFGFPLDLLYIHSGEVWGESMVGNI